MFDRDDSNRGKSREDNLSAAGGRRLIVFLGGVYVVLAVGLPFMPVIGDVPLRIDIAIALLAGVPGSILLYTGYRLPQTGIRPELSPAIARWCGNGIGVVLVVITLVSFARGTAGPVQNTVILTALGSVAGLAVGVHDARAKTRELELQETVEQLQTSNERLERFAYAASHDLQEPLRMVSSYLQLLDSRYHDQLDADAQEFLGFAVDGADRMRAMVNTLLDYSRVASRNKPLEPTDAGVVLQEVREDLRLRIDAEDATITADELPIVTADAEQLAQVFRNILSNALTYSGERAPRVHISAERTGDMWRFSVADEGIGIDPEYHDRIFEVFEKLHGGEEVPAKRAGGIGLALCERIIERHGGEIWVDSEPGEGATFSFTLLADSTHSERAERSANP